MHSLPVADNSSRYNACCCCACWRIERKTLADIAAPYLCRTVGGTLRRLDLHFAHATRHAPHGYALLAYTLHALDMRLATHTRALLPHVRLLPCTAHRFAWVTLRTRFHRVYHTVHALPLLRITLVLPLPLFAHHGCCHRSAFVVPTCQFLGSCTGSAPHAFWLVLVPHKFSYTCY